MIVGSRDFKVVIFRPDLRLKFADLSLHLRIKRQIRVGLKRCDRGFEHIHAYFAVGLREFLYFKRNRHFRVGPNLWPPETIFDPHIGAALGRIR